MITLGCPGCQIMNIFHKYSEFITRRHDESGQSTTKGIRCLLCRFLVYCFQVFESFMVILAAHATKPVKLGSTDVAPLPHDHQGDPNVGVKVEPLGDNNRASFIPQVQDNSVGGTNTSTSTSTNDDQALGMKDIENGSRGRKAKAPKKMVSINDKVEEFYISNKRKRSMVGKWASMDDKNEEIKPLKSILKVGSKQR